MNRLNVKQTAGVELVRRAASEPAHPASQLDPRGHFRVEHWRGGKRINEYQFPNGITDEGKDQLLNAQFDAATQVTTWYLGLIDDLNFTSLSSGDIYDDINQAGNGWDEFTDYTDAGNGDSALTRPAWTPDPAASQSITNGSPVVFDVTASGTVKGVFVVGGGTAPETKGDHAVGSTLWATALFGSGDVPVQNGDQLKVTYTVSA
ncbi:MAG: hypothetical protein DWQ31_16950 [Planctomycetota bacterium]|nr:MAG: hypothetical protein DWQ31_16950 [Planctomycetota bacterium]REJ92043.1 MAG: hypothetical protein DWQ35_12900 [Planctomycetota bacterium]REK28579.1 MAG: hypothetical protein DWQ42_04490 [Planctomycetota bacterium]REK39194.1 MAG: hypothetical protein DWQ46_18075 [Planctomycetota bacterium]